MRAGFLSRITTGSTLAELPGHEASLELSERAKKAGDFFHSHPEVPGLLLTEGGRFRTVLSRRYYLDVVGRYCGMDLSLSLRNVVRFVAAQAKEKDAGQLDVYRAFVRVSPRLLQRNGITTLRFEEDRLVSDPELQEAILKSVRQVVGKDCPPEVFVNG